MIINLFKTQFRDTWRISKWTLFALLTLVVVNTLFGFLKLTIINIIFTFINVLAIIAVIYANQILIVINDYKNFHGQRSYFYQAIPANTKDLFWSRFLHYSAITLIVGLLTILTAFIMLVSILSVSDLPVMNILRSAWAFITSSFNIYWVLIIGLFILNFFTSVFTLMFSVTIGSDQRLQRLSFAGPILVYIVISFLIQIVSLIFIFLFPFYILFSMDPSQNFHITTSLHTASFLQMVESIGSTSNQNILPLGVYFSFLPTLIVLPIVTYRFMKNRVSIR